MSTRRAYRRADAQLWINGFAAGLISLLISSIPVCHAKSTDAADRPVPSASATLALSRVSARNSIQGATSNVFSAE
jgi:hypothetical protein